MSWAWFSTPQALAEGVWLLAILFTIGILTEWAKIGAQLVGATRRRRGDR